MISSGPTSAVKQAEEAARLRAAVQRAKEGDVDGARQMFEEICTLNNNCEAGWLWLASLVSDAQTGLDCLREVLRINPDNRTALAWLAKSQAPDGRADSKTLPKCPLCKTSWPEVLRVCISCRALLDLSDPDAFAAQEGVDRKAMEGVVERLTTTRTGSRFELEYTLALAHLNLLHSGEALKHLLRASRINSSDPRLEDGALLRRYSERRRVAVVDDSATIREVLGRILEKAGYMAVQIGSGQEALASIEENKPELVLLDISMPGMDGYQVCKAIRSRAETKEMPVVLISTKDGMFDKAKGRMAGANEYVTKPFQPDHLLKVVRKYAEPAGKSE